MKPNLGYIAVRNPMSVEHQGYVGFFKEPLGRPQIESFVLLWLERYGSVEQAAGGGSQVLTINIRSVNDLMWQRNLEFRVSCGEQFAWIYLTQDRHVIETSGLAPHNGSSLCHDVLVDVPGCSEIIDENNAYRLDELEARGLM